MIIPPPYMTDPATIERYTRLAEEGIARGECHCSPPSGWCEDHRSFGRGCSSDCSRTPCTCGAT